MAYDKRIIITQDRTKLGGATHTDFSMLVWGTYPDLRTIANGGHLENGNDFAFFSDYALTTPLSFRLVHHNVTTGAFKAWVKVPSLSHTVDTPVYIGCKDAAVVVSQADPDNAFDGAIKTRWGMGDGTTLSLLDGTANNNDATNVGTATAAAGQIGGAVSLNGTTQWLRGTNAGVSGVPFTMSIWAYLSAIGTAQSLMSLGSNTTDSDWFRLSVTASGVPLLDQQSSNDGYTLASGASPLAVDTWTLIAGVWASATSRTLYVNGVAVNSNSASNTPIAADMALFSAGVLDRLTPALPWGGRLDEGRLIAADRASSWMLAEYHNQSTPSAFYSVGSAQSTSGPDAATLRWYRRTCLLMVD